ncbi:erythrocyte membrane protein 1 [Plasmodium falciparum IGH-CR14]|uniref:Erythrocyte membrane protein 1 n=1 Tax=Plasmodium falciparum IGH-CR14 TaxID=580059 RepID=A0A0L1I2R7_PLAFA|nr:erythrocyte membrane protein 1 [Plasmodium falciparum IGH-CR14]
MVRPKRVPTATIDYTKVTNVKELLDLIGKYIQQKVHGEALEHSDSELHGFLSKVIFSGGHKTNVFNKCDIDEQYETNVTDGHSNPCEGRSKNRFSYTEGAECDKSKIKGSNGKSEGACAPLRRLSLCDQNLEHIKPENIKDTHNLYIDVLLAAKYEGKMIAKKLEEYDPTNYESRICTELARSFADIGDIIRGKDLYLGYNRKEKAQKEKLEQNLKKFFQNIDEKLPLKAKNYYTKEKDPNFLKLREDWWELNRQDIWKALTCNAPNDAKYFRKTACAGGTTPTHQKCTCATGDVPTYFDYVPQYLRWFEEWTEDFCRKRKHKLKDAIKKCRGEDGSGEERYCDLNGYDCKGTFRAKKKYRWDYKCTGCFRSCSHFRTWIDNQKEQFLKQRNKYQTEISGGGAGGSRKKRNIRDGSNDNGYEKIFYEKLKESGYGTVDKFLEKLNEEDVCKKINDEEEGIIDFKNVNSSSTSAGGDGSNKTFSHTEYCQACPLCGVEKKNENWERKEDMNQCPPINLYRPKNNDQGTPINFLYSGDETNEIAKKLNAFCLTQNGSDGGGDGNSDSQDLYQKWTCYQIGELTKDENLEGEDDHDYDNDYHKEVKNAGGLCILKKEKKSEPEPNDIQKTFNPFFYYWVVHMLKDSIHWRTKKLDKCINNSNESKACKNNNKCKTDCDCFEKWVGQKKTEWKAIKDHFGKQDFGNQEGFDLGLTADVVLERVLEKNLLLTSLREAYGNEKDIEHIKKLLKEEENVVDDNQNKTTIDKLLNHELNDAKGCLQKQDECEKKAKPPIPSAGDPGGARSLPSPPHAGSEDEEEEEEEEEDEEDGDDTDDGDEVVEEPVVDTEQEAVVPPTRKHEVNPCDIVKTLFSDTTKFSDACKLKYGPGGKERYSQWKCIPSGDKTATDSEAKSRQRREAPGDSTTSSDNKGGLCIPPRRRRLYVGKLHEWASGNTQSSQPQAGGESQDQTPSQSDKLRTAFIESAAVETFFQWHKYKKEWEAQHGVGATGLQLLNVSSLPSGDEDPQNQLKRGKIPPDFLRQMFYTFADYKDILEGKNDILIKNTNSANAKDEIVEREKTIKDAIQTFFQQTGDTSLPTPGTQPSVKTPQQTWWQKNGEHIWNGMICALTYEEKTNSASGSDGKTTTITQDTGLKGALLDNDGKPKSPNDYENVELKEEDSGQKAATASQHPQITKLTDFVNRPTYFRWLEEWGETFCKERKKRLAQIKVDCTQGSDKCSGDGENCETIRTQDYDTISDLKCPSCATPCNSYRKWIGRKKIEFEEQKSAYTGQKDKCKEGSESAKNNKDYKQFCGTLGTYGTAAEFLKRLKNGPCSKNDDDDNDNVKDEIDFGDVNGKTFQHTEYCGPCPKFKTNCQNGDCNDVSHKLCNGKNTIDAKEIGTMRSSTEEVDMYVSDNSKKDFESDLKEACQHAGIFKGIRKDEWKCGKVCGVDICEQTNINGGTDGKEYIQIRALLKRWVENFLEDYNKIRKKLKPCINNENGSKCEKKYECVEQWITKKTQEWGKISNRYLKQYKSEDDGSNDLTNFLQQKPFHNEVLKAIKPCGKLDDFVSKQCNGTMTSENSKEKNIVECLLDRLKQKIDKCKQKQQNGGSPEANCGESSPLPDDEEENPEENTLDPPKICPEQPKEEVKEESGCEPASPGEEKKEKEKEEQEEPASEGGGTEGKTPTPSSVETDKQKPKTQEEKLPQPPSRQPQNPWEHPLLKTALMSSTIMWSIGIGFATFTYFYLKKKSKSSVGNLFQILQIPKSDYDIPTKLSPNRYIPYTSGKYRGKRYIYLEGDSGTDSGYTDHYSDITSSSESEYEELDINEIYPYQSPKYKTLIEVVLEPSGNNTTASGNNTPSDTQNDIQNDGIPSSKITDNEWNTLKDDFISNMLQNEPNDVPNDYKSGNSSTNTNITTTSRDNMEEKPFITSIHDRDLYSGEEISYNINMSTNIMDDPKHVSNNVYSGIDLINDTLSGNKHIDIYDELLKRKENELFGINHKKHTTTNIVAKQTHNDPIVNQINLFHTWLDRHRDMCEKWENHHERLAKLKEEWENETHSGNTHPSDSNKTLNTNVSIQIHMDNPKPINEFTYVDSNPNQVDDTYVDSNPDNSSMDTILEDLDKPFNEPYYYDVQDDIYYDVNDDNDISTVDSNNMDVPSKVQIEMDVNTKLVKEKYPIADNMDALIYIYVGGIHI